MKTNNRKGLVQADARNIRLHSPVHTKAKIATEPFIPPSANWWWLFYDPTLTSCSRVFARIYIYMAHLLKHNTLVPWNKPRPICSVLANELSVDAATCEVLLPRPNWSGSVLATSFNPPHSQFHMAGISFYFHSISAWERALCYKTLLINVLLTNTGVAYLDVKRENCMMRFTIWTLHRILSRR
jgi:hypothetical protein